MLKITWKDDTRRFRVPAAVSFENLRNDVAQKFGLAEFRLKYIDEENELITVASDRELHEAIDYLRETDARRIIRFFVRPKDDPSSDVTQSMMNMSLYERSSFQPELDSTGLPPSTRMPSQPYSYAQNFDANSRNMPGQPNPNAYGFSGQGNQYEAPTGQSGANPTGFGGRPNPNPMGSGGQPSANPYVQDVNSRNVYGQPNPNVYGSSGQGNQYEAPTGQSGANPMGFGGRPHGNPSYELPQSSNSYGSGQPNNYGSNGNQHGVVGNVGMGNQPRQEVNPSRNDIPNQYSHVPQQQIKVGELGPSRPMSKNDKKYDSRFIRDKEVNDGAVMKPGQTFTKVWVIKNTGELAWPPDTVLEWQSGDRLDTIPDRVVVPEAEPGQEADVTMQIVAPKTEGNYTGHYRMALRNGSFFGNRVWVDFAVKN